MSWTPHAAEVCSKLNYSSVHLYGLDGTCWAESVRTGHGPKVAFSDLQEIKGCPPGRMCKVGGDKFLNVSRDLDQPYKLFKKGQHEIVAIPPGEHCGLAVVGDTECTASMMIPAAMKLMEETDAALKCQSK